MCPLITRLVDQLSRHAENTDPAKPEHIKLLTLMSSCCCHSFWIFAARRTCNAHLYTLNAVRCPYVRTFVRRNGGRGQISSERRHNENDVTMIIAGLWRYGDWRHVATGYTAVVKR